MKTLHESMLYLGYLTGTLHQPEQRAQMLELLRSEEGRTTTAWLVLLRDAVSALLREAGREPEHAPPLTEIAIAVYEENQRNKSAIDHPNEEGDTRENHH